MKHLIMATLAVAFTVASAPSVLAQAANSRAEAGAISGSSSNSVSGSASRSSSNSAINQALDLRTASGAVANTGASSASITFNTPETQNVVTSGTATLKTAPPVTAPSMGSGHPCAIAPVSVGISVIGGGASAGGQVVDEACLLAQMGQGQAALIMIARRDKDACLALRETGAINPASNCGESTLPASTSSSGTTRPQSRPDLFNKCALEDGAIKIRYTSAGRSNKEAAKAQCLKQLGY